VAEFMESVCDELQLDMHVAMKLQVAMEEMVTNVIFYDLGIVKSPPQIG
jgi:two-component sensor histidine kinase